MAEAEYPVLVAVDRGGGRVEEVRVGTATRSGDGFVLRLGDLRIAAPGASASYGAPSGGGGGDYRRSSPPPSAPPAFDDGGRGGGGMTFPNYGRSKGQPIYGATMQDLEYYANGARRSLADPNKARWHDKEKTLLAAIEAEVIRQRGGVPPMQPDDGGGRGGGGASFGGGGGPPFGFDDRPPPDDDVPF